MAAPSWHAPRREPLIVLLDERRTRLKGADWFVYCAVTRDAAKARTMDTMNARIVNVVELME